MALKDRIANLLLRRINGELSPEEEKDFQAWLQLPGNREFWETELPKGNIMEMVEIASAMNERRMDRRFVEQMGFSDHSQRRRRLITYLAAASILSAVLVGVSLVERKTGKTVTSTPRPVVVDVLPGTDKAILKLADGRIIQLDAAGNGQLAQQGSFRIVKDAKGHLNYEKVSKSSDDLGYNTLATPPAAQFQVTLPDGTRVWLNNASSLTYPFAFTGKERRVQLDGEAFFDVAKMASRPFHVEVKGQEVQVLGTSFNISSYPDETVQQTTLIDGSIKVVTAKKSILLRPGDQARVGDADLSIIRPDINSVIAWRRGFFNFANADVKTIMRQIARWYDVEVVYEGPPSSDTYDGLIDRDLKLSEVLAVLHNLHINTRLTDRKIIVSQ